MSDSTLVPDPLGEAALRWRRHRPVAAWRLRRLRLAADLTQIELAARSGLTHELISRLERGRSSPLPATLAALAAAMEVAPGAFVVPIEDGLPAEPVARFGELGRLTFDAEGLLICHLCGRPFADLGKHAAEFHGVSAKDYRRQFGLKAQTRLVAPALYEVLRRERQARVGTPAFAAFQAGAERHQATLTPEQRGALTRGRIVSLEERQDPARLAASRANLAKAHALQAAQATTPMVPPKTPRQCREQTCRVCGRTFTDPQRHDRLTCGPACLAAWRRRKTEHRQAARAAWGSALRTQRQAAGLSQSALAARVGVGHSMIAQMEIGTVGPSVALAQRLAEVLPDLPPRPGLGPPEDT